MELIHNVLAPTICNNPTKVDGILQDDFYTCVSCPLMKWTYVHVCVYVITHYVFISSQPSSICNLPAI